MDVPHPLLLLSQKMGGGGLWTCTGHEHVDTGRSHLPDASTSVGEISNPNQITHATAAQEYNSNIVTVLDYTWYRHTRDLKPQYDALEVKAPNKPDYKSQK